MISARLAFALFLDGERPIEKAPLALPPAGFSIGVPALLGRTDPNSRLVKSLRFVLRGSDVTVRLGAYSPLALLTLLCTNPVRMPFSDGGLVFGVS